ncbi:hypothetical protein BDW22DRAFT_64807 [Trametopsis cervina]|nr:hypothetical protein BDW22DRAFT_64807 [Trametopsis cervina]
MRMRSANPNRKFRRHTLFCAAQILFDRGSGWRQHMRTRRHCADRCYDVPTVKRSSLGSWSERSRGQYASGTPCCMGEYTRPGQGSRSRETIGGYVIRIEPQQIRSFETVPVSNGPVFAHVFAQPLKQSTGCCCRTNSGWKDPSADACDVTPLPRECVCCTGGHIGRPRFSTRCKRSPSTAIEMLDKIDANEPCLLHA